MKFRPFFLFMPALYIALCIAITTFLYNEKVIAEKLIFYFMCVGWITAIILFILHLISEPAYKKIEILTPEEADVELSFYDNGIGIRLNSYFSLTTMSKKEINKIQENPMVRRTTSFNIFKKELTKRHIPTT